ncbi:putative Vacuolar protein sorting-associated protein VTA1 like protein [Glarea lozoyensis 74030]|uniref:Putative Vacuolar protein sorting-associated protein VTA1 like protein n=1 Tax=Glarea lozoyensis (strain ATCC 74030 / MF5533) TaxID=1104152 RepID=H0EGL9_GLAL7|nr:putative Vacuolar protein sorting-associated protein VTA1 like protein [Glarea lozoyensis 74030]
MAANIPPKLKTADLTRFIVRAAQLEKAKPVISYWCEYWIVNQILSKGLHNGDQETLEYTTTLMDKLEQVRWFAPMLQLSDANFSGSKIKSDNPTNDAIIDDTAGQAYVEQFALETFQRADRTVQVNKVTKHIPGSGNLFRTGQYLESTRWRNTKQDQIRQMECAEDNEGVEGRKRSKRDESKTCSIPRRRSSGSGSPPHIVTSPGAPLPPPTHQPAPYRPPPPPTHYQPPPAATNPYHPPPQQHRQPVPPAPPVPGPSQPRGPAFNLEPEAVAKAQKHAKWAISALNFEDADTAVKELRLALQILGAQ